MTLEKVFAAGVAGVFSVMVGVPAALGAAPPQEIYPRDSAKTVFGPEIFMVPQEGFSILNPQKSKKEEEPVAKQLLTQEGQGQQQKQMESGPDSQLTPQERILKEFGDPLEPVPVKGIETAPKPYRAMLAALNEGDEELAFKYAVQYVRYMRDLEKITSQAVAIEGQAMVRENVLGPGSWPESPEYSEYHFLQKIDLGDKSKELESKNYQSELDAKTRDAIKRLKESEHDLFSRAISVSALSDELNEQEERMQTRRMLSGRVPLDPQGRVDMFFFLRIYDREVMAIAGDIEKLYQGLKGQDHVNFIVLTIDGLNPGAVDDFRRVTKTTFPIVNGERLAQRFKVKRSPTMIYVTQTNNRFFQEEGLRNYYHWDELLKIMQGK
ncbi:MAG: hypothetical protein GX589_09565 [Deltaproteobacteria bacterium]|nr:hypothetical protein [Deltaproteobacteria bacterium]